MTVVSAVVALLRLVRPNLSPTVSRSLLLLLLVLNWVSTASAQLGTLSIQFHVTVLVVGTTPAVHAAWAGKPHADHGMSLSVCTISQSHSRECGFACYSIRVVCFIEPIACTYNSSQVR